MPIFSIHRRIDTSREVSMVIAHLRDRHMLVSPHAMFFLSFFQRSFIFDGSFSETTSDPGDFVNLSRTRIMI